MGDTQAKQSGNKGNPDWVKGVSGNPHGRPKTGQAIAELFRNFLEEDDPKHSTPERRVKRIQRLAERLYQRGEEGNVQADRALLEWGVPKPPQRVDLGTDRMAELAEAFDRLR